MKVKFTADVPECGFQAGQVHDLSIEMASRWLRRGKAVKVTDAGNAEADRAEAQKGATHVEPSRDLGAGDFNGAHDFGASEERTGDYG